MNQKRIEFFIVLVLLFLNVFFFLDRYLHFNIFYPPRDNKPKTHTVGIKTRTYELDSINVAELTFIPPEACLIPNAEQYINGVEYILNKWGNESNFSENLVRLADKIKNEIHPDSLKYMDDHQKRNYIHNYIINHKSEINFKEKLQLPEIDFTPLFTVLNHIRPEDDYILDYLYYYDIGSGIPMIYARRRDTPPYSSMNAFPGWEQYLVNMYLPESLERQFTPHIITDQTALGYFQLAVLSLYCDHFFLVWHSNYRDETIVTSFEDAYKLMELTGFQIESFLDSTTADKLIDIAVELDQMDLTPYVIFKNNTAQIVFYYFTYLDGLYKAEWIVDRAVPHQEISFTRHLIIKNEAPILF